MKLTYKNLTKVLNETDWKNTLRQINTKNIKTIISVDWLINIYKWFDCLVFATFASGEFIEPLNIEITRF